MNVQEFERSQINGGANRPSDGVRNVVILEVEKNWASAFGDFTDYNWPFGRKQLLAYFKENREFGELIG